MSFGVLSDFLVEHKTSFIILGPESRAHTLTPGQVYFSFFMFNLLNNSAKDTIYASGTQQLYCYFCAKLFQDATGQAFRSDKPTSDLWLELLGTDMGAVPQRNLRLKSL